MASNDVLESSVPAGRAERLGNLFFRYRGFLPFVPALPLTVALLDYHHSPGDPLPSLPWELVCMAISLAGFGLRVMTAGVVPKGTSGRNTRGQKAFALNTTGMYSLVRNPLYLGNALVWLGLGMFLQMWWTTAIIMAMFAFFHAFIIHAESQFLRRTFGKEYEDWASNTPAFIPRLRGWKKPALPFSFRTVCRREHASFFSQMAGYFVLEVGRDIKLQRWPTMFWIITFAISLMIYLLLRTLKKKTTLLDVPGR